MSFLQTVADVAFGNVLYRGSLDKLNATFPPSEIPNADAIVTITILRRNDSFIINETRSDSDYDTLTIGMKKGQTIDKVSYSGFEEIWLDDVTLKPNTKLVVTNSNRFMTEFDIINGDGINYNKTWTWPMPHPNCFALTCSETPHTGYSSAEDNYYYDSRFWGMIIGFTILIVVLLSIIFGNRTKQKFTHYSESFQPSYGRRLTIQ